MRTHVKIWIAAANLHDRGLAPFRRRELLDEATRLFPGTNPLTLSTYATSNVNVSGSLPHSFAYIIKTSPGTYRLTRSTDRGLRGKPLWPDQADVDEQFWPLWRKWMAWQQGGGPVYAEVAAASEIEAPAVTVNRQLADGSAPEQVAAYVRSLPDFTMERSPATGYGHMGAIISEAIL